MREGNFQRAGWFLLPILALVNSHGVVGQAQPSHQQLITRCWQESQSWTSDMIPRRL